MGYDHIYRQRNLTQIFIQQCQTEATQRMREAKEAAVAKQQAERRAKAFEEEKASLEAYRLQLEKDIQVSRTISTHQRAYARASKDRAKAANQVYQQRLKALKTEVRAHNTAIAGLKLQMDIVKAEFVAFDMQDAADMQLEDERRLPAAAAAARLERETKRSANDTVAQALTAETERLTSRTASAKARFEAHHKRDCARAARLSLCDLQQLKSKGAFAGHGEHKFKFWNAIRRVATGASSSSSSRSAEDLKVFEQYRHELERPCVDLVTGACPTREEMDDYAFSCVKEDVGFFSMKDFVY
jgi:hypothetical protein